VLMWLRELLWLVYWLCGNVDRVVVMGFDDMIFVELWDYLLFRGDVWVVKFFSCVDCDFFDVFLLLWMFEVEGFVEVLFCYGTVHSDEECVMMAMFVECLVWVFV